MLLQPIWRKWSDGFLKRDDKNPDRLVYVSTKGEVSWDVPVDKLPTVEEKRHWDRHPKFCVVTKSHVMVGLGTRPTLVVFFQTKKVCHI